MSQADYTIADQDGASYLVDINNQLAAIVSNNSGATEPATTYAYQWWADTSSGILKQRNAANSAWVTIGTMAITNLGHALAGANSDITSLTAVTAITTTGGIDIIGTNTNDSASTGYVGEYVSSTLFGGSAIGLTSGVSANVTTITLTAGDWDVSAIVGFNPAASTSITYLAGGISSTSATLPASALRFASVSSSAYVPGVNTINYSGQPLRFSSASTITIYLVASANFTVSTLVAFGNLSARRVR